MARLLIVAIVLICKFLINLINHLIDSLTHAITVAIIVANAKGDYMVDEYEPIPKNKDSSEQQNSAHSSDQFLDSFSVAVEGSPIAVRRQLARDVSVKWSELSWKILCDQDEWRAQLEVVRKELTQCLELREILLPEDKLGEEEEKNRKWSLLFSDGPSNPYCRLSHNWLACHKLLDKVNCLAPDTKPLEAQKKSSSISKSIAKNLPIYDDPDEWVSLHRAYKLHCLTSKMASASNPFGMLGMFGGF